MHLLKGLLLYFKLLLAVDRLIKFYRLLCSAERRLGRLSVEEIKGQAFFKYVEWEKLHECLYSVSIVCLC